MDLISICIPTYEMHGKAKELLARSFGMLKKQTYKNFEVIISDNSEDDVVKKLCEDTEYKSINIKYSRNPIKGLSLNTNESMRRANGKLIKILFMDDYLKDENSLWDIVENFKGYWMVTGCAHDTGNGHITSPHCPSYTNKIYLGKNTIGSPSVLTLKNDVGIYFDEKLTWLNDCDFYIKCAQKFGEPTILNKINVVIGTGRHQTTHHLPYIQKIKEHAILWVKHHKSKLVK